MNSAGDKSSKTGVDLDAVSKLVHELERDLEKLQHGSGDVGALRDEVRALGQALQAPALELGLPLLGTLPKLKAGEPIEALRDPRSPLVEAIDWNRRMWRTLAADCMDDRNALTADLRAKIARLRRDHVGAGGYCYRMKEALGHWKKGWPDAKPLYLGNARDCLRLSVAHGLLIRLVPHSALNSRRVRAEFERSEGPGPRGEPPPHFMGVVNNCSKVSTP